MVRKLMNESINTFEEIRKSDKDNNEYWFARDLQSILDYESWNKFKNVIEKAKNACIKSNNPAKDHFSYVGKLVQIGSGASREIEDIKLSRYACYLIVQNGDPSKEVIALGQTYFAVKTREKEISEKFESLTENDKRLRIRNDLREHNKSLAQAAKLAGVNNNLDYAIFQNHGYKGLYDGLGVKEIHVKKGLKKSEKILDNMGSTELAANLFRATQADEKLRRENILSKDQANEIHFEVGAKVRQTIKELGGTMPENLPNPKKSLKQLEKEKKRLLK